MARIRPSRVPQEARIRLKAARNPPYQALRTPWDPVPGVPGSIQHLPRIPRSRLWPPGENSRRYRNRRRTSVLLLLVTRRESRPLSPEGRSTLPGPAGDVQHAAGRCRVPGTVYPGRKGMALAGHLMQYYQGGVHTTPPSPYSVFHVDAACLPSRRCNASPLAGRALQLLLGQLRG